MVHIKITKGLDIPIKGSPTGSVQELRVSETVALNLDPFDQVHFKLLIKKGDVVKIGQPLVEDKNTPGRFFASPASGVVAEVRRGLKRRLLDIIISVEGEEQYHELGYIDVDRASKEAIIDFLKASGAFTHIRQRPFDRLADPALDPRSIFIKAIESAPFVPPAELQVLGHEKEFALGLKAISKLAPGKVHLVHRKDSPCIAFTDAQHVHKHTAEGPHPIGTHSLHIQQLDPITSPDDCVWTLNAHDVVIIGHLVMHGRYFADRVIGIGGPGIIPERIGYFKVRAGSPIDFLLSNRIENGLMRLISGDPITGKKVELEDFLGFYDFAVCAVPENINREFLSFLRPGFGKYSFSKAYPSGHLKNESRSYNFTTSLHGEERAFIDGTLYDQVMPLRVPTMTLVKAVMAEDYEQAQELGLLEVAPEDFALPTFVCPSKIEMTEIIKDGLRNLSAQILE